MSKKKPSGNKLEANFMQSNWRTFLQLKPVYWDTIYKVGMNWPEILNFIGRHTIVSLLTTCQRELREFYKASAFVLELRNEKCPSLQSKALKIQFPKFFQLMENVYVHLNWVRLGDPKWKENVGDPLSAWKALPCSLHSTGRGHTLRLLWGCKWWRCSMGSYIPEDAGKKTK